jgi:uncharacterized OB-fold protein
MERPIPVLDQLSAFYWNAAARGELLIQQCGSCGTLRFPPALACLQCHSFDTTVIRSAGRGFLWSYSLPRRPNWSYLAEGTALAVVELDEGVRIPTNLTDADPAELRIGLRVEVWFDPVTDDIALPMFRPVRGQPHPEDAEVTVDDGVRK